MFGVVKKMGAEMVSEVSKCQGEGLKTFSVDGVEIALCHWQPFFFCSEWLLNL